MSVRKSRKLPALPIPVHIEQPTTTYMGKYATTTTIAAQPRGSTKPSGITGKPHGSTGYWTTAISYRPTTWPWAVRTTSYVSWPVTTSRGGQATRLLFYTSTTSGWPHRTGSSGYSTSTADQSGVGTTRTRNPEGRKPVASSKTEASRQLDKCKYDDDDDDDDDDNDDDNNNDDNDDDDVDDINDVDDDVDDIDDDDVGDDDDDDDFADGDDFADDDDVDG